MRTFVIFQIYSILYLVSCASYNKESTASQSSHRNLRDKEVEELPSTQTNKEDKENYFVLERGFDYYPDNYYPNARKPYYGASNFPDHSPQDGYYPLCNPRMYSRDPRFDDPYYRRKFRNV